MVDHVIDARPQSLLIFTLPGINDYKPIWVSNKQMKQICMVSSRSLCVCVVSKLHVFGDRPVETRSSAVHVLDVLHKGGATLWVPAPLSYVFHMLPAHVGPPPKPSARIHQACNRVHEQLHTMRHVFLVVA